MLTSNNVLLILINELEQRQNDWYTKERENILKDLKLTVSLQQQERSSF